jgi:hypothetical protein
MAKKNRSNLTGRITIRFTPEELEMLDELADEDNERKPSSLCRRIILGYIKDRLERQLEGPDQNLALPRWGQS